MFLWSVSYADGTPSTERHSCLEDVFTLQRKVRRNIGIKLLKCSLNYQWFSRSACLAQFLPPAYGVWREGNVFSISVCPGGGGLVRFQVWWQVWFWGGGGGWGQGRDRVGGHQLATPPAPEVNPEAGGAGGTPLTVTQEACLVLYLFKGDTDFAQCKRNLSDRSQNVRFSWAIFLTAHKIYIVTKGSFILERKREFSLIFAATQYKHIHRKNVYPFQATSLSRSLSL